MYSCSRLHIMFLTFFFCKMAESQIEPPCKLQRLFKVYDPEVVGVSDWFSQGKKITQRCDVHLMLRLLLFIWFSKSADMLWNLLLLIVPVSSYVKVCESLNSHQGPNDDFKHKFCCQSLSFVLLLVFSCSSLLNESFVKGNSFCYRLWRYYLDCFKWLWDFRLTTWAST